MLRYGIIIIVAVLGTPLLLYAQGGINLNNQCYALNRSQHALTDIVKKIYRQFESSQALTNGFPRYGKTKTAGDYASFHTLTANPVTSHETADSIMTSTNDFITFQLWGLNSRPINFTDRIFLLKEKDDYTVQNGLRGMLTYKYIEIDYSNILPVNNNRYQGDFSKAEEIIAETRQAIKNFGAENIQCP